MNTPKTLLLMSLDLSFKLTLLTTPFSNYLLLPVLLFFGTHSKIFRPISPPKELLQLLEEQGDFFLDGSEDEKEEKMEIGVEQEKGEKVGKFFAEKGISTTF